MISLKHYTNIRRADTSKCNTKYSKAYAIKVGLRQVMFRVWAFKKRNCFPLANKKIYIDRIPSDSQEKVHNYFIFSHLFKEIHSRNIIAESCKSVECLSAAWPSGSEGRFYDVHVRKVDGSTPTQAWL